ncbi:hypothetical protein CspeluHIS016_0505590 [Cutaneotrichosporon spelunceum]|uniref:Myb-like domain-containing protein n=1 Tax=Cutaneotrichosporon spelunceum TaxID=1672016 RepID=A0AAD3TY42_9TREE|nr:hypothetical protein CspeluHIS016_0505590 [Cutaneotrichosporon spelunceum]
MKREASYEPSDEDIKPKKLKGSSSKAPGRTWTSDELDLLFTIALTGPTRANFDGKIEGRTALQCQKTWENTLLPYLHKMAREKGAKKK